MRPILFSKSLLPLFHARSIISGQINDPFVAGNILESLLLADHTNHSKGRDLLSFCAHRSTFMYNTLLHAYVSNKLPSLALLLFDEMLQWDTTPNNHTFPPLLKAMGQTGQLKNGASLHSMILKYGFSSDQFVRASLIHFYGSLGAIVDACHVFRENSEPSVSSWTALLSAYVKNGNLISAREVFDKMPERNLVSWSAMISGYVQFRQPGGALVLFQEMMGMKVQPSHSILVSILVAVAELGALQEGKWVHGFLERSQIYLSSNLKTSLVHMYAKCGDLMSAKQTFETLRERNVDLWNAMIAGLGLYGKGEEALELFADMVDEGIQPDDMTFICSLSAYSHSGMVAEGRKCFEIMRKVYKIDPKVEHYSCMVDLLAKAGLFMEAVEFIQKMPMEPNDRIWGSLFSACRIYGDIGFGEAVGKHLIEMEPHEPGCYVLFANLYASTGRWKDALTVRGTMKSRGVEIEPGCSLIEVDGMVHEFLVDDRGHPSSNDIYKMLDKMAKLFEEEIQMQEGICIDCLASVGIVQRDLNMGIHSRCCRCRRSAVQHGIRTIVPYGLKSSLFTAYTAAAAGVEEVQFNRSHMMSLWGGKDGRWVARIFSNIACDLLCGYAIIEVNLWDYHAPTETMVGIQTWAANWTG
ncbi:hypothetical protein IEQ34_006548 [Dendrobium chrysotoxum]|uniref:Pentatricopeptide repeat-containing protein n=1 Tax=Dendrobium chrysotoxum TaxID=161865 RepID=A0AAV7H5V9_DENCH|nr:hypothetical protein IEQ34_006548 [Dendrobium chrysotoxum]